MLSKQPQLVSLTRRVRLTDEASDKQTFHLELDLSQTDIQYDVGDCLAIYPENDSNLVEYILNFFPPEQVTSSHREFLTKKANLNSPSKKLTERYRKVDYLTDILPVDISLDDFCAALSPLLPRFYSIASSMKAVGKAAHLTITVNHNPPNAPLLYGLCSDFLCHRAPVGKPVVLAIHHPAPHFSLPKESVEKPIIMIGPGTGIAPFRGFMQERMITNACPQNWIFFGERTQKGHYYYQQDWESYTQAGCLEIDLAFSRDSENKIYVQHKMLEKSKQLWQWLHNHHAYLFVCGDAKQMAKAVEATLLQIFQEEGLLSLEAARDYIKQLRREKRYLRDVY